MKVRVLGMHGHPQPEPEIPDGASTYDARYIQMVQPVDVEAASFGEAIAKYSDMFSVTVTPYGGGIDHISSDKGEELGYYIYSSSRGDLLVSAHIERGNDTFCLRHDFGLPLQDGDLIILGAVGC